MRESERYWKVGRDINKFPHFVRSENQNEQLSSDWQTGLPALKPQYQIYKLSKPGGIFSQESGEQISKTIIGILSLSFVFSLRLINFKFEIRLRNRDESYLVVYIKERLQICENEH